MYLESVLLGISICLMHNIHIYMFEGPGLTLFGRELRGTPAAGGGDFIIRQLPKGAQGGHGVGGANHDPKAQSLSIS